jgi:hypothetical protein
MPLKIRVQLIERIFNDFITFAKLSIKQKISLHKTDQSHVYSPECLLQQQKAFPEKRGRLYPSNPKSFF